MIRSNKAHFPPKLCDMDAEHSCLLFYSSTWWLSLGNTLLQVYELRNNIYSHLYDKDEQLTQKLFDEDFVTKLTFLTDIFEKLNIPYK